MSELDEEKQKQFQVIKAAIDKKWGANSIRILGGDEVSRMPRISSGVAGIDDAIGGGWPWGRFVEIYGPESSGKTTLTLEAIASAQREGKSCAFIDAEHALDVVYAENLGVDVDQLIISQPDTAEEALDIVEILTNSGMTDLIVVDSVAALVPKAELEGEMGQAHVGIQARLMSQALRKLTGAAARNNVLIFFINQIRYKIGVMFGSPETTSGGNALKFYSSIRVDVRRIGQKKDGDTSIANETRVKIVKNKTAAPYKTCEFLIKFGEGVDKSLDLLRLGVKKGLVDKAGAWYSYENTRLGQGEANSANFLKEHTNIKDEIVARLEPRTVENTPQLEVVN